MRASGNGTPAVCANNLLRMVRGEVPFDRVKGLDPRLVDRPLSAVSEELEADAEWLIETYEPRVQLDSISVSQADAVNGGFVTTAKVKEKEG